MIVIESSTGKTVDLSGLTPGETALAVILAYADPDKYNGADGEKCLLGLPVETDSHLSDLYYGSSLRRPELMATETGADLDALDAIYDHAADPEYKYDLDAALDMAARQLEVPGNRYMALFEQFYAVAVGEGATSE